MSVRKAGLKQDIAVIKIEGSVDSISASELEYLFDSSFNSKCFKIIVDLDNVDYIGSAGWAIFLSKVKEIRENGGDIKLVSMQSDVYEVFELLELDNIFKAFNTVEEAISDFETGSTIEMQH